MALKRTSKHLSIGLLVVVTSLIGVLGYVLAAPAGRDDPPIMVINGEEVASGEFRLFADAQRAKVYDYFKRRHGVDDSPQFWQTEVGGETPSLQLKLLTTERLIDVKVQQQWAKQEGIIEDNSYSFFQARWAEDTETRSQAVQRKQVIYGPRHYDEMGYYEYVFSNMVEALKRHLADTTYKPTERQIQRYYEEHLADYTENTTATLQLLYISNRDQQGEALREKAQQWLSEGKTLEDLLQRLDAQPGQVQLGEQRIGGKSDDPEMSAWLVDVVADLAPGQRSDVLAYGEGWMVVRCVDKQEGRILPLEEVHGRILYDYASMQYEAELAERKEKVKIEFNDNAYKMMLNP